MPRRSPKRPCRQIAQLYAIEGNGPGPRAGEARLAARAELAAPIVTAFRPLARGAALTHPEIIEAGGGTSRYALGIWPGLTRFLEDGRFELDTNPVENQIRPIALTRKKRPLRGPRGRRREKNWAMLASLIATCKMSDVEPDRLHRPDPAARSSMAIQGAGSRTSCPGGFGPDVKPRPVGDQGKALTYHLPCG